MSKLTLHVKPPQDQESWNYTVPPVALLKIPRPGFGKCIKFTADAITLDINQLGNNRILQEDNPSKFIAVSFGDLRFPDCFLRVTADYIKRFLKAGLFLNGIQYRFYHHSNSQLRSRSCFLREAKSDAELDARIYKLGDFGKIMNVAKRAKRIGLLFSGAEIDFHLDPTKVADIEDMMVDGQEFSDGCGLMSKALAVYVSKSKKIIFRGKRYTPCVYQIRYLGYKGVLMIHPQMDREGQNLAEFRKSMKKFTTALNDTFSVVGYSQPYSFGRLNNDIIVLLSSLGVTNEKLLAKQEEYFKWLKSASHDVTAAIDLLYCVNKSGDAERALLNGLEDPPVARAIRSSQMAEIASFRKNDRPRTRMIIHKSRLIFGVCDPYKVLKEGQVHIRITTPRGGASTPINADVLVVRNPCLHPGDCLKLRAVSHPALNHLVDCIVFAAVARSGHPSAPSMSSGGDLDGDQYFVCWDPDLVPPYDAQSYNYPPNKERVSKEVTREELANHFASYNNSGLAKVAKLHQSWMKASPNGAMSSECQELNALHSQSVDGARIKIPERLLTPPEPTTPYIIDLLSDAASEFASEFAQIVPDYSMGPSQISRDDAEQLIIQLFRSKQNAVSEFEVFDLALKLARKHDINLRPHLAHLQFSALTSQQKHSISFALSLTYEEDLYVWNSLIRSDILTPRDLAQRQLNKPLPLQRLYSSKVSGLRTFWQYLHMATQDFTRKLLILKTDDRFSIGVFMRGEIPWDDDPVINNNVVVCSFLHHTAESMSTYKLISTGHRLHCSDNAFQLYREISQKTGRDAGRKKNNDRVFSRNNPVKRTVQNSDGKVEEERAEERFGDTFVKIGKGTGADVVVSVALGKISDRVRLQCGQVRKMPVTAIELHVVSNRDRVAHQLFDLYFEHVQTELKIGRFDQEVVPYALNQIQTVDWAMEPLPWLKQFFLPKQNAETTRQKLAQRTAEDIEKLMEFCIKYHAADELFWVFTIIAEVRPLAGSIEAWLERHPPLVFVLLKAHPPDESSHLPANLLDLELQVVKSIIRSANAVGIASLVALEKITGTIAKLPTHDYLELLLLATLSVRPSNLVQEVLLVLNDCRASVIAESDALAYVHKHALAVAFDRAEEAADECPCNEQGRPRKGKDQPIFVKLFPVPDQPMTVIAHVRIDSPSAVRLHSHVRLMAASDPEKGWVDRPVLDAVVLLAAKGEMKMELQYPAPPEFANMQWKMFNAGSVATTRAMLDAIQKLLHEGAECCRFSRLITDHAPRHTNEPAEETVDITGFEDLEERLNKSQIVAVKAAIVAPLALIWGPPGTGKTTVVVQILRRIIANLPEDWKILMSASTHNAVDNVLERFVEVNKVHHLLPEEKILRVATDSTKVSKALQSYTVDARVGGDTIENKKLLKKAQERIKAAVLVFTTCAGAGLGILRKVDFEVVLIDEASQITEPCALIPLVKGCKQAVLVGDHVQLRPTVKPMAKALEYDVSLLERLYTGAERPQMRRTMLDVQYRFPKELAAFPSREFYEGRLQTGTKNDVELLSVLESSTFPWPRTNGVICPTIFIQCDTEEDMGGMSKSNEGQAQLAKFIVSMITTAKDEEGAAKLDKLKITGLSPYSKQVKLLKNMLPSSVPSYTIDSFQGRESDVIIFSTVRCNAIGDIGFVEDARRLNVMWTRARLALIIIGDQRTMGEGSALWKRAIEACKPVIVTLPVEAETK